MSYKIFPKFYVGFKNQHSNDYPLAFLTPYEENAAGLKRQQTVDTWAKGYTADRSKGPISPKIIDNVPLKGFMLSEEVRRGGWTRGNVVWRVVDPRGWEFEITSANLASIIDCCTIRNGLIDDDCILVRDGANNLLVPINSTLWQEINQTIKEKVAVKSKPRINHYEVGDLVVDDKGIEFYYLGDFSISVTTYNGFSWSSSHRIISADLPAARKERYKAFVPTHNLSIDDIPISEKYFIVDLYKDKKIVEIKSTTKLESYQLHEIINLALPKHRVYLAGKNPKWLDAEHYEITGFHQL